MTEKLTATMEFERVLRIEGVDYFTFLPYAEQRRIAEEVPGADRVAAERAAMRENAWSVGRDGECELWIVLPGKTTVREPGPPMERYDAAIEGIQLWAKRLAETPDDRPNEATTCLEEIERHAGALLTASREWK
jgi:hypothetical protein